MEHFCKKKYRHLKSKILVNSIGYYFLFFILLAFLTSFSPISPIQTCQKILKFFVVLYYTDYRFYQISICYISIYLLQIFTTFSGPALQVMEKLKARPYDWI